MKKEKFHIEYIFDNVSRRSLWNHITTPPGLSAWFADDVTIKNNIYVFKWNKTEQEAEVLSIKPELSIRYRWADEEDANAYFEFQIFTHELTGATSLQITDFAEADEKHDSISLWDTQIETLKRTLGI
ncbi:MAG: hypothetical protein IKU29_04675 [Parabacteroides sp.]|nr:hypothetical protein [Parabacteroides sp.]